MQRITTTIDADLTERLGTFGARIGAGNRSEATRELIRRGLGGCVDAPAVASSLGALTCTIDQSIRNLAMRILRIRHERHNQILAALSVPFDHFTSLEVTVMRGQVSDVVNAAEALFLDHGVMHGTLRWFRSSKKNRPTATRTVRPMLTLISQFSLPFRR